MRLLDLHGSQSCEASSELNRADHTLLVLILIIAIILRLWDFESISLMNDELSALHRLQFNSFSDLRLYGIRPDGHPAGVQVFLYFSVLFVDDRFASGV